MSQKYTTPSVNKYMVYCFIPSGRWLKSEVSSIILLLYSPSTHLCKLPTKNWNQWLLLYSLPTGALVTLRKPNSNPKTFRRGALTTHLVPCFLPRKKKSPNRRRGVRMHSMTWDYLAQYFWLHAFVGFWVPADPWGSNTGVRAEISPPTFLHPPPW